MRTLILAFLTLCASRAVYAADVGVRVTIVGESPLDTSSVSSVVWHAIATRQPVVPVFVDASADTDSIALARDLVDRDIHDLLDVSVAWRRVGLRRGDGTVGFVPAASVRIVAYSVDGNGLHERSSDTADGGMPVIRDGEHTWLVPEVSLQRGMLAALEPTLLPGWGQVAQARRVPVVLAVDTAWQTAHGTEWRAQAEARIAAASKLLAAADITLDVIAVQDWHPAQGALDLTARLADLAAQPRSSPNALRIGLSRDLQTDRGLGSPEEVGRAYEPGRDLVIESVHTLSAPTWQVVEDAVVITHEVLHALGVPHQAASGGVMSRSHTGLTCQLSASAIALARAAVEARWAQWDQAVALQVLSDAAERELAEDPSQQLAFLVGNLRAAPPPGTVAPGSLSPIADTALARLYLQMSVGSDLDAAEHRAAALSHARAAQAAAPWLAAALERAAQHSQDAAPSTEGSAEN